MKRWKVAEFRSHLGAEEWLDRLEQEVHNLTVVAVVVQHYWSDGASDAWLVYTVSYTENP